MYPKLSEELLQFLTENLKKQKNTTQPNKNAQIIILDIKLCILDKVKTNEDPYKLRDNKKCTDEINVEKLDGELDVKATTSSLMEYIEKIKGPKTKEEAKKEFLNMITSIETYLSDLEKETKRINNL